MAKTGDQDGIRDNDHPGPDNPRRHGRHGWHHVLLRPGGGEGEEGINYSLLSDIIKIKATDNTLSSIINHQSSIINHQ